MRTSFIRVATATAFSLILASPLVMAQAPQGGAPAHQGGAPAQQGGQPPAQTYQAPQAAESDFSDEQLDQFANSYIDILEIQQDYTARLEGTDEPEQAQQLQQEANQKMVGAIQDNGLDVEEYTAIARAMDSDPQLREQVVELVSERHQ